MQRILYFDIINGISGDMTLGALLDLGVEKEDFLNVMNKLSIKDEFEIKIDQKMESGIKVTDVDVVMNNKNVECRHLKDVNEIIDQSLISDRAKKMAKDIFMNIAIAEAYVHNTSIDKVHFHEVGAIDSIVDIIGCSVLIDMLDVDKIVSSSVILGTGFIKCDHGIMPLPAPATIEILKNCKVKFVGIKGETTTPTGAAIIKSISDEFCDEFEFEVNSVGYGIGSKKFEVPNMLRVVLGQKKK